MSGATLRVVVAGGGFGGMSVARGLARAPVEITLLDRQNHQCFQPLLYQVATATLTPADIAWPIRRLLRGQANTRVYMQEVERVDLGRRQVITNGAAFGYDILVVATGATHGYFGHEAWAAAAPGLKTLEDAIDIRSRLLTAFERAELAATAQARAALTTFVVVGGGPTGVEMAGAISDMARLALTPDFQNVDRGTPASSCSRRVRGCWAGFRNGCAARRRLSCGARAWTCAPSVLSRRWIRRAWSPAVSGSPAERSSGRRGLRLRPPRTGWGLSGIALAA